MFSSVAFEQKHMHESKPVVGWPSRPQKGTLGFDPWHIGLHIKKPGSPKPPNLTLRASDTGHTSRIAAAAVCIVHALVSGITLLPYQL